MAYHVDSEVGRLRQAILHRPDLELKRLTPSNKDELLFDEILWVKSAKPGARRLRRRPARGRRRGAPVRPAAARDRGAARRPQAHPRHRLRRAPVRADGHRPAAQHVRRHGRGRAHRATSSAASPSARSSIASTRPSRSGSTPSTSTPWCSRPCPTPCSPATPRPGSTAACRSTPCARRRACGRRSTTRRSTATTRSSPSADFEVWAPGTANGVATTEGGDMLVLGRGAVLVGMSERTRPQGVERLAARLFAAGAAHTIVALRHAGVAQLHAPRHGHDHGRRGHLHQVRRAGDAPLVHDQAGRHREGAGDHRARTRARCTA